MGAPREDLMERARVLLWRRAAYWMYLRWQARQDRAHWPAITRMPLVGVDKQN